MRTHAKRNLWVLVVLFGLICGFNGVKKKSLLIVFIGDSITYGAAVGDRDHFAPPAAAAAALQQMALVKKVAWFNGGRSGATTLDFLPGTPNNKKIIQAADAYQDQIRQSSATDRLTSALLFSIMLGTNDSAIEGTNGAPVSPEKYQQNLQIIIDTLLSRYPGCRVVLQEAPWYSDNTYNGAKYLSAGRRRLLSYNPKLKGLADHYKRIHPGRVFLGDQSAFGYFRKNFKKDMAPENGHEGVFYLHPNKEGSLVLGQKWAKVLYKAAFKDVL